MFSELLEDFLCWFEVNKFRFNGRGCCSLLSGFAPDFKIGHGRPRWAAAPFFSI